MQFPHNTLVIESPEVGGGGGGWGYIGVSRKYGGIRTNSLCGGMDIFNGKTDYYTVCCFVQIHFIH